MPAWVLAAAVMLLLGGLLFFALGVEAFRRYSTSKLHEALRVQPARLAKVTAWLDKEDDLLSAAQVWLTLVELSLAAVLVAVLSRSGTWPLRMRLVVAVAVTLLAMVVVRRGVAAAVAMHRAEAVLIRLLPALAAVGLVMRPFAAVERFVVGVATRLMGESESRSPQESIEEEILSAVDEGKREGVFAGDQAAMIHSIIDLRELDVREVMTPRTDLVCLPAHATLKEAARTVQESGHSRLPVYRGNRDNVIGVLFSKDLLVPLSEPGGTERPVSDVARKPYFVPETKAVWDLLQELRQGTMHVAIVVDEYGGTAGLVTDEDILEEVVGEIAGGYGRAERPLFKRLSETAAEVDARLRVDELNAELHTRLPEDEDYDTVGGLAFAVLGRVPSVGERFTVSDVDFAILEAGSHRVQRLRVDIRPPVPEA